MFTQIRLGYPALWLKTTESSRAIASLVNYDSRDYFTIDSVNGFCRYTENTWKPIAVQMLDENGNSQFVKTYDFSLALEHLDKNSNDYKKPKTFIFNVVGNPDQIMFRYIPFLSPSVSAYRESFWKDDIYTGVQYIFISSFDVPKDYPGVFREINYSLPSPEELYHIVDHIKRSSHDRFVDSNSVKDIVRAGIGLTEIDFIDYCLKSIVSNGTIDAKYVYDNKMAAVKQNGILEIIRPKISFNDIGGLDNIKNIIRRTAFLRSNQDKAKEFGVVPIRRVLMVGVPGTGKSAICQATAKELQLDLARTGISQVMNSFVGQSEANMRAVFAQIKAMTPLCVWIDEFGRDLSGGASSASVDAGTTDRVHGEFLTGLQELPEDTFLMCAANQLDNLRPEMLRADRFDKIIFVGLPSFNERLDIFRIYLKEINTDHQFDYEALSYATEYFTGAEIASLIKEVKFFVVSDEFRPINTQDILSFVPNIKNTIWNKHRDMVQSMYRFALEQWDWASSEQMQEATMVIEGRSVAQPQVTFKI